MNDWYHLPDYSTWTGADYLIHAFWGLVGALVRMAHSNTPIDVPRRTEEGAWKLNAIGAIFIGLVVGTLVDHNPLFAVIAAIGSSELIESIVSAIDWGSMIREKGAKETIKKWLNGSSS